jgi:hypothetical protein
LKKFPHEVRALPSSDVFLMLAYYRLQGKRARNEVDIDDLSDEDVVKMFGAENG